MSRRRDRLSAERNTGVRKFYRTNGTLPRSNYGDLRSRIVYAPFDAVVPSTEQAPERRRQFQSRVWKADDSVPAFRQHGALTVGIGSFIAKPIFDLPHRVKVCVRRKQRREVLFAFDRAGYSGSARKKSYRRTGNSNYGC